MTTSVSSDFRILTIDDNPAIHQDFMKILTVNEFSSKLSELDKELFGDTGGSSDAGNEFILPKFHIDTATQGQEGVEHIKQAVEQNKPYALAFVDIRMPPGWDGIETIKHIWEIDKDIQIVICTAFSDYSWEETIEQLGISDNLLILKKPFDNIAVRQLACALTKKWQLIRESAKHTEMLEENVKKRTKSLQYSMSVMRATFESSTDGLLVVDNSNKVIDYNNHFVEMWKVPQDVLDSKNYELFLQCELEQLQKPDEFLKKVQLLKQQPETISTDIVKLKDGRIFERYSQPYKLQSEIIGRVLSFRDITQRAYLEKTLEYHATHDSLTGLPNRLLLLDRIRQAIARSNRHKNVFAVLFFDLDRFKLINDSINHEAGDQLLQQVAKRLSAIVRAEDTVARLGGDEFVMIAAELAQEQDVLVIANKLLNVFKAPFNINQREYIITASIGVSIYPNDGTNVNALLRKADLAMYYAKEHGGNQFHCYTDALSGQNITRLEMETDLRRAIENHEFQLVYQPQFDLEKSEVIAVEALIRWQHPTKGLVVPNDFIPLAEETGMIIQIGEWVMRTACEQNKAWQDKGLPPFRIAVNVATQQLKQANFAKTVQKILQETGLDPKYLEIEVTENVIITNEEVSHMIGELNKVGVQIVLDDFGTGNASLNNLKKIRVSRLKIDQSFVQNISTNHSDEVIIQAIVAMGKSLNFDVVAEGVETGTQLDFLKKLSCNEVQGFYFSKPLSSTELEHFFSNRNNKEATQ